SRAAGDEDRLAADPPEGASRTVDAARDHPTGAGVGFLAADARWLHRCCSSFLFSLPCPGALLWARIGDPSGHGDWGRHCPCWLSSRHRVLSTQYWFAL